MTTPTEPTVESAVETPIEAGAGPDYDQILSAIGERFWHLAGEDLAQGGHRDLVFATTWQDAMWAVAQGVRDAYDLPGIAGCPECEATDTTCAEHLGHPLLKRATDDIPIDKPSKDPR